MQNPAARFLRLAALGVAGALALFTPAALAQRQRPVPPPVEIPPPAQPLAVKVNRGEPVEIQLRIFGRKNEPLKYLIRAEPRHGKVTEPRVLGREVSVVIYTPPADLAITRDRFAYAVQNGAGVSAAVDVTISIVDPPPELALPGALDFSAILVGATAAKSLEVSNRGGGIAEGKAEVEAPWKIVGTGKYRLAAGERTVFKVVFAPESGGQFESAVRFSSDLEKRVRVKGDALAAISAAPAKVVLQSEAGDPVRTGVFELVNQTDEPRRVTLVGGDRLQVPAEVTVPAQGRVSVPVQTAAGDVAALAAEVRAEAAGLTVRVPVQAAQVGPIVRAASPSVVFGRVDAARGATVNFELENIGGTPASASWEIAAPFATGQTSATLAPGEKKAFSIRTQPAAAGRYRAWLTVKADPVKLEIPVSAELGASAASALAGAVASESAAPQPAAAVPDSAASPITPVVSPEFIVSLRTPEGVRLTQLTATSATIEWPAHLGIAAKFRAESRGIAADAEGAPKVKWTELSAAAFRREGGKFVAELSNLQPLTGYGVRIVPLGSRGEAGEPLFAKHFVTPPKPRFWPRVTVFRVLIVIFAVCAVLILRQRRAQKAKA